MPQVSSSDVQKDFGAYRTLAESGPVHVTHKDQPSVVILTADEYARLKRRDKGVTATEDLPEWLVQRIANSKVDPVHALLDAKTAQRPDAPNARTRTRTRKSFL